MEYCHIHKIKILKAYNRLNHQARINHLKNYKKKLEEEMKTKEFKTFADLLKWVKWVENQFQ